MASPHHVHEVAAVHATTLLWAVNVRVQFEKRVITNGVAVIAIVNSSGSIEHDPHMGLLGLLSVSLLLVRSHFKVTCPLGSLPRSSSYSQCPNPLA